MASHSAVSSMRTNVGSQKSRTFRTLLLAVAIQPDEIGRRIKKARERKGWTQLEFASEANVSPSSVQRWESGRLPPVRELWRIAGILGVPTEDLVEPEPDDGEPLSVIRRQLASEVARLTKLNDQVEARLAETARSRPVRKRA
jgi:transcriptional regulator with XRE-family HTH domain